MAAENQDPVVQHTPRVLRETTKKLYNQLYNRFKNQNLDDPEALIKTLREQKKGDRYIGTILSSIRYGLLQNNAKPKLINKYNQIIYSHFDTVKKNEPLNDAGNQVVPEYEDMKKKFDEYVKSKKHHKNYNRNVALLSIYLNDAPRRILDVELLHYVKTNDASKMEDKKKNYYIKKNGQFIYNYYKTFKDGQPTIVKVPKPTTKLINQYIEECDIKEGESLFKMSKSNISNTVESILGARINGIRRSYVNNTYKNYNIPTNEFIEEQARKMEHSVKEELNYRTL